MARPVRAGCPAAPLRPALEVATIVRAHGAAVRRQQSNQIARQACVAKVPIEGTMRGRMRKSGERRIHLCQGRAQRRQQFPFARLDLCERNSLDPRQQTHEMLA